MHVVCWLLLIVLAVGVDGLRCHAILKGVVNGSTWNFDNELTCEEGTFWCVTVYGRFDSDEFKLNGVFANCEDTGLLGPLTKPLPEQFKCQVEGCTTVDVVNATRCCCDSDLCNVPPSGVSKSSSPLLQTLLVLFSTVIFYCCFG